MQPLISELERRWDTMFTALVEGDDVPPAQRLRTEGLMESVVMLELAPVADLVLAMDSSYRRAYGRGIAEDFGDEWQDFYPFPQIPAMGQRAPVYPSTD